MKIFLLIVSISYSVSAAQAEMNIEKINRYMKQVNKALSIRKSEFVYKNTTEQNIFRANRFNQK